jgi:ankyrin repeat protein
MTFNSCKIIYLLIMLVKFSGSYLFCMDIFKAAEAGDTNRPGELLHFAALRGHADVIRMLISAVKEDARLALVTQKDRDGNIPLHYAANVEVAQVLIEAIPEEVRQYFVAQVNYAGWTPLDVAVSSGRTDIVRKFLAVVPEYDRPAYIAHQDRVGWTPLHRARKVEIAGILIDAVPEKIRLDLLNKKNFFGFTPLHAAALNRYPVDVIQMLIAFQASIYAKDNSGMTPAQHARVNHYKAMIDVLAYHQRRIDRVQQESRTIACILAQALHVRLGEKSPLSLCSQEILQKIVCLTMQTKKYEACQPEQNKSLFAKLAQFIGRIFGGLNLS